MITSNNKEETQLHAYPEYILPKISNTPFNLERVSNVQIAPECSERRSWQWLGHDVSDLVFNGNDPNIKLFGGDSFANKVIIYLNMLGPTMKNWISR